MQLCAAAALTRLCSKRPAERRLEAAVLAEKRSVSSSAKRSCFARTLQSGSVLLKSNPPDWIWQVGYLLLSYCCKEKHFLDKDKQDGGSVAGQSCKNRRVRECCFKPGLATKQIRNVSYHHLPAWGTFCWVHALMADTLILQMLWSTN